MEMRDGKGGFFAYPGSLTTPPYTETVQWVVLESIRDASREQIERLEKLEGENARGEQPLHRRMIEGS